MKTHPMLAASLEFTCPPPSGERDYGSKQFIDSHPEGSHKGKRLLPQQACRAAPPCPRLGAGVSWGPLQLQLRANGAPGAEASGSQESAD
eukprot:6311501-Alexandrium_andersonii.AAC.1